ncbi:uncharacterized protein ACA1_384820 [Acanthamoeba castellanii str. Neff]|uniref:N-acetyltransferase domain-containing protein n=1 Tax=Acanthamoeba castellanii (strain ATCC 30010 / Neff) TaxID=1257118 RepID=L8HBH2_ACACF|nr:uncharacterized protein ACA1_384820 [Acanthamoeba castellanii str. Neff]ELR21746.1 hypothetical protein ACA1_384820 [Acanthamoeba castellanii str. Neff]
MDCTTDAGAPLVVSRYNDAAAVLSAAQDFFAEDELLTSLPYGILRRLSRTPDLYGAEHYFLSITTPDPARAGSLEEPMSAKSRVVLLAMQTGRWPLAFFVSPRSPEKEVREAVVRLLRHLNESGQAKAVGKVEGQSHHAAVLAALWNATAADACLPPLRVRQHDRFHMCERVVDPSFVIADDDPTLRIKKATEADVELLAAWYQSFRERLHDPTDLDGARRMARSWLDGEEGCAAYLLLRRAEHKGEPETPVSLCLTNRETPHTRTISMVYTPAEHGCKGYATRLVASVTQIALAVKRYCCLFTDLANPHRHLLPPPFNYIYYKVGYRTHSEWDTYETGTDAAPS